MSFRFCKIRFNYYIIYTYSTVSDVLTNYFFCCAAILRTCLSFDDTCATFVVKNTKMNCTYPKNEKLKSRNSIEMLFSEGKSVARYPLRLVYLQENAAVVDKVKFGVSVSKKYFREATDRNYFKRVLREAYRFNKHLLISNAATPYIFMLLYQSKDRLSFQEINNKTAVLFNKFRETVNIPDV